MSDSDLTPGQLADLRASESALANLKKPRPRPVLPELVPVSRPPKLTILPAPPKPKKLPKPPKAVKSKYIKKPRPKRVLLTPAERAKRIAARKAAWYRRNKIKVRNNRRKWRARNRQHYNEMMRAYAKRQYHANPEYYRAYAMERYYIRKKRSEQPPTDR